ncbi:hypothetical protein R84B8_02448 [Treponema sp. R8-4-B8]
MKNVLKLFVAMRSIAIIALVAVIGFSMAACSDGSDSTPTTYPVTVYGGSGSGSYAAGATVSISATAPSGQTFTNWTVNSGGATLANANSASTTFTMPTNAVTVTANFTGGGSPNYSIEGDWEHSVSNGGDGEQITVSGSTGVWRKIGAYTSPLALDGISKGYYSIGGEWWRNITSTGNLTWSGQTKSLTYNTSNPNVTTGWTWYNCTFTMSSDGQTLNITLGTFTHIYTRITADDSGINPDVGTGIGTGNLADRRYRVEVYNTSSTDNWAGSINDAIRTDVISRGHTAANTYTNQTFSDVLLKWNSAASALTSGQITEGTTRLTELQTNNRSGRILWFFYGSNYRFFYVNRTGTNPNYYTVEVYNTNSDTNTYLTNTYSGKTNNELIRAYLISRGYTANTYTNQTFSDVLSKWSSTAFTSGQITQGNGYLTSALQTNNESNYLLSYFQGSNYRVFYVKQE